MIVVLGYTLGVAILVGALWLLWLAAWGDDEHVRGER